MAKELWKGNEAVAEAAIRAGCRYFFGYELPKIEGLAARLLCSDGLTLEMQDVHFC